MGFGKGRSAWTEETAAKKKRIRARKKNEYFKPEGRDTVMESISEF
ncbi:conserved hypothetical protein [delta proteobacterium NaphS2]|nr:conserved hypothetical protein [delta proteobacterium NaphS2]